MKKTYISIFCGLLAILFQGLLVSCDEHEPMDYGIHVGYVLCDDHSCMDTTTYFSQTSKKGSGCGVYRGYRRTSCHGSDAE